jgi:hypothetical protein
MARRAKSEQPEGHRLTRVARGYLFGAIAIAAIAAGTFVIFGPALAASQMMLAAASLWFWRLLRVDDSLHLVATARSRLQRGDVEAARTALARLPAREISKQSRVARATFALQAAIAWHDGDAHEAESAASKAIAIPPRRSDPSYDGYYLAFAHAMRALARAALGRAADADADAAAAETMKPRTADVFVRIHLARAIAFARAENRAGLASTFAALGVWPIEWLAPRERSLLRALRRMAHTRRNPYRESAGDDGVSTSDVFAAWIARIVPNAPVHAVGAQRRAQAPGPAKTNAQRSRIWNAAAVSLVVLAVAHFFLGVVWDGAKENPPPLPWPFAFSGLTIAALLVGRVVLHRRNDQERARALYAALFALARNDADARAQMDALVALPDPATRAWGHYGLGQLAERSADWSAVVDRCNRGLAAINASATLRAWFSDTLLPAFLGGRAWAHAALGKKTEAQADLDLLAREPPSYSGFEAYRFGVALMSAVRDQDMEAAGRVARTRVVDVPLGVKCEMLADIVAATVDGAPEGEIARLEAELRENALLCAWIDAVAPSMRARLRESEGARSRVAANDPDEGDEDDALPRADVRR